MIFSINVVFIYVLSNRTNNLEKFKQEKSRTAEYIYISVSQFQFKIIVSSKQYWIVNANFKIKVSKKKKYPF